MHTWSKYKHYLFTSFNVKKTDIRVIYDTNLKKSFFCFDDMMANLGYLLNENSCMDRSVSQRYIKRIKMQSFIELFPGALFVPVEAMKSIASTVSLLSNQQKYLEEMTLTVTSVLRVFLIAIKNRKEVLVFEDDNSEDFMQIHNHLFSVATHQTEIAVKATDVMRYCGYKNTKVPDNIREYAVKLVTKNGISNFLPFSSLPFIAESMHTPAYARKMKALYIAFLGISPKRNENLKINQDKSVIQIGAEIIPYVMSKDNVMLKTSVVQRVCGYKKEGVLDNFRSVSEKIDDIYYMSVYGLESLADSKLTPKYKENIKKLAKRLERFA